MSKPPLAALVICFLGLATGHFALAANPEELLLSSGSVSVRVSYRSQYSGESGNAKAVPQNDEVGYFYFSDPHNPEVFVKVLDFGASRPYLLFYTGLTDFEYTVSFTNVRTGKTVSYVKPAGSYQGGGTNDDLPHASSQTLLWSRDGGEAEAVPATSLAAGPIGAGSTDRGTAWGSVRQPDVPLAETELKLLGGTIVASLKWRSQYSGETGTGFAIPQQDEYGYFYFSDPRNVEVVVKALDFGSSSPYLVFHAGMTDFQYEVTFKNVNTNQVVTFQKPAGSFVGGADNSSLCHGACPPEPPKAVSITLPGNVPLVMVRIPGGTFQMGSPRNERNRNVDETQHPVTLTSDYYMGRSEVTQGQWKAVMGYAMSADCGIYGIGDAYPVYCVSWDEIAVAGGFLDKLNQLQSTLKFRLPTEAEWEKAARGGTETRYSFGNAGVCDDLCQPCVEADPYVWFCANSGASTRPAGQKGANPYGLHDVHGNVWEWTQDWYEPFTSDPRTDPKGPSTGQYKVIRGGDCFYILANTRSAARNASDPTYRTLKTGFRLAANP